jgi:hypothetical protein
MGAARPRAADVTRRLAAAIAVAGTLLVALVVCSGAASAAPTARTGALAAGALTSAPLSASLASGRDLSAVAAASSRGQGDLETGWAEPATVGVLLAEPVGFFVGLFDTSDRSDATGTSARVHERAPPAKDAVVLG